MHHRYNKIFILLSFLLLLSPITNAQDCLNISVYDQYYHNWQTGVNDVAVYGDYAYLACQQDGLRIINIAEPYSYYDVARIDYEYAYGVDVSGSYAFVAIPGSTIKIIDVSNPAAPQETGEILIGRYVGMFRVIGDYLYTNSDCEGLLIYDISDPLNPIVVSSPNAVPGVTDIEVHGDIAYGASYLDGLLVIDISDFSAINVVSSYELNDGNWVNGATVSGNYAYLACGWDGFRVVDLTTMQAVSSIDSLNYAFGVDLVDSHVYLNYGDPDCPLAAIDVSDPCNPRTASIYYPPQDISTFVIRDNMAYVADFDHGLRVVNISNPENICEAYRYNRTGQDYKVFVANNLAYIQESHKLKVVDVSDLTDPHELGYFELDWWDGDMKINGNIGYIARCSNKCLLSVDLSDPAAPDLLGSFTTEDNDVHYELAIYDHYAYITENYGLRIIDISDPGNMLEANFIGYGYNGRTKIDIIGQYLFLQGNDYQLKVYDLTDPISPALMTSYNMTERCTGIKRSGELFYLTSSRTYRVFELPSSEQWTPLSMSMIFPDNTRYIKGMEMNGKCLYLTDNQLGLNVFDITDYSSPRCVGYYQTPGSANGIAVLGDIAIIADGSNLGIYDCSGAITGIEQADLSVPEAFSLLPNYPNPFNASTQIQFELPSPDHVAITIFDILGRDVATLADRDFAAGKHSLIWNGTDADGRTIASGRYFIRAKAGDATQSMPILLLK